MKHQLRDLMVLLISLSGLSYLYRSYLRRQGPLVRVLCFHDVSDRKWFEEVIEMIVKNYHLVSPEEFKTKRFLENKINILLTFDDGYQTWIDNCLPALKQRQAQGIFFINSGLLDIADDKVKVEAYMKERLLITPKSPLTWTGARQLVEARQTLGGHTVSHPNLAALSQDESKREIVSDKVRIEGELGVMLEHFAYPFGTKRHIKSDLSEFVKTVYPYQYSAITGFAMPGLPIIPRTLLEKNQSLLRVKDRVNGSYDILTKIKNLCVR